MDTELPAPGFLLGADGPLAGRLPGFAPRAEQLELAEAVARTLSDGGALVAEAGTGTGKTLAYLVPVLRSGLRAIISTGTKTLQDQLFFRDLPLVVEALGLKLKTALLKGRANYLCLQRMERAREQGEFRSRADIAVLEGVVRWSGWTRDGDLSVAGVLADDSGLWPMVTSTNENCLGTQCPHYDDCFVLKARRAAQEADLVVVNHHLLFADMAVRQGGFGEVLPGAEVFVLDEAHQAPDIASRFFSSSLSARQVNDLMRDILAEAGELAGGAAVVRDAVDQAQRTLKELQACMAEQLGERGTWPELLGSGSVRDALQALDQAVADLEAPLKSLAGASRGLDGCQERRAALQARFDLLDRGGAGADVRWFERSARGFELHVTPLDIASRFSDFRELQGAAWIFTSATLSVRGDFSHFVRQLGLADARTLCLDSPFDYANNALLWLPGIPGDPHAPAFTERLLETVEPVLEASRGRAFLLFTSHRALQDCAAALAGRSQFPLFVQGTLPRSLLLEQFRASGNGVLLGTASFWEGVDVMGEALSLVVIDKLPFAAPDDPVLDARGERLRQEGGNPFMDLALPQAVLALKQGAGRLIRDVNDRGVLVICDPRLTSKAYGAWFLDSLPPMRRAGSREEVLQFFADQSRVAA